MELALCAGCLVCAPRRAGVRVCSEREVDKEVQRDFSIICFEIPRIFSFLKFLYYLPTTFHALVSLIYCSTSEERWTIPMVHLVQGYL